MPCITLWWHSLLSDEVWKLRVPYSSSTKKSHSCICYDNSKYSAEDICGKGKKERFSSLQAQINIFFFFREKHESLWKSLISIFLCFNRTKWNGTKLLITKNALSPPWILNCSAFQIVSYRCSSVNWYNSCIFSRTKFPTMNMTNTSLSVDKIKTFIPAPQDIQLAVQMSIMVDSYSEAAIGEIWTCCSTKENNIIVL